MKMNAKMRGEFECREFLGEETWKKWKQCLDECFTYRKSINGKPTIEQIATLKINSVFIDFYNTVLYHSVTLGPDKCECRSCALKRK